MNVSRLTIAAALIAGFAGIAQAQSAPRVLAVPAGDSFMADNGMQWEGRSVAVDRATLGVAPVPASESDTVMGLSVPR